MANGWSWVRILPATPLFGTLAKIPVSFRGDPCLYIALPCLGPFGPRGAVGARHDGVLRMDK